MGKQAFQLTGFVSESAQLHFYGGSSRILSTARPELPYLCNSQCEVLRENVNCVLFYTISEIK